MTWLEFILIWAWNALALIGAVYLIDRVVRVRRRNRDLQRRLDRL